MQYDNIFKNDKKIYDLIIKEENRQKNCINLIASENYASLSVMQAQGSCLTNKYAEGYFGNRFYNGCDFIDKIEKIAINRAKKAFCSDYANVQPHSGSQANFSILQAILNPGDSILGMNLNHGGHLTHGSSVNFSGKLYNSYFYGVDKNGFIDYEQIKFLSNLHKPKLIIAGFSSYSRFCDWKKIREIADSINAYFLADISHVSGLIISGLYPSPINYAHVVSTTTHKTLGGPRGGLIVAKNGTKEFYKKIDLSVFPGTQGGPLMHVISAKAISLKETMTREFKLLQKRTVKYSNLMASIFIENGFSIVSNGTDNHLFLIDLSKMNITGKKASDVLSNANIIVNKNLIPGDHQNPFITSGIRIGTSAIAKRCTNKNKIIEISLWIINILKNINDDTLISKIKKSVILFCQENPINL